MGRRLVVHIGLPKSGSSTLQKVLGHDAERLGRAGFSVLGVDGKANQEVLANALLNLDGRGMPPSALPDRGSVDNWLPAWDNISTRVISMESFFEPGPLAVQAVCSYANTAGATIDVVGFIRSPETWLWSYWTQETKSVWTDWCAFLERMIEDRTGFLSSCFGSWVDECPDATIKIRSYEGPGLVNRFHALVGFPLDVPLSESDIANRGEDRLEAIRRAVIVHGIWQELLERAWLESAEVDGGVAAYLVLHATQRQSVGFESAARHRAIFPDRGSDPTFNEDSHPLVAAFAEEWARDAEAFVGRHGERFDAASLQAVVSMVGNARRVSEAYRSIDAGNIDPLPCRNFVEVVPIDAWELALIRGMAGAVFSSLIYIDGLGRHSES